MVETTTSPLAGLAEKARVEKLSFYYGTHRVLKNIDLTIPEKKVTALIGPSGCGKTTLLRCFNRMHDLYPGNRYEGQIRLFPENTDILAPAVDPIEVRMRISMVPSDSAMRAAISAGAGLGRWARTRWLGGGVRWAGLARRLGSARRRRGPRCGARQSDRRHPR